MDAKMVTNCKGPALRGPAEAGLRAAQLGRPYKILFGSGFAGLG